MKHIELLKAWVDGETIQYKNDDGVWIDLKSSDAAQAAPAFFDGYEYRKKPQVVKYRRWLAKHYSFVDARIGIVYNQDAVEEALSWPNFVRWIDMEWQEEEV